jgi:hypothetical protein
MSEITGAIRSPAAGDSGARRKGMSVSREVNSSSLRANGACGIGSQEKKATAGCHNPRLMG